MQCSDRITAGRIRFTTDAFLIQFTDKSQFIDFSGDATLQPDFDEHTYNHQRVSTIGHMGDRSTGGDPNAFPRVQSFIARRIVLQRDVAVRAFEIFQSGRGGSALDDWVQAERELLLA